MRKRVLAVAVTLVLGGCSTVGGASTSADPSAAPPTPDRVVGTFGGRLTVEGTEMEGILELTTTDSRYHASFTSEGFGFQAAGSGQMRGDRLDVVLAYDMDCRGELRLRGRFDVETGTWSGELAASDCTGDATGDFMFARRAR